MKINNAELKEAKGDNTNAFYQTEKITTPVISDKATIDLPRLKQTWCMMCRHSRIKSIQL